MIYKSLRIIDGKPWVIENEDGNINKNPTKEQLKGLEKFPEKDGRSNPRVKYYLKDKDVFGIEGLKKWLEGGI